MTVTTREQGLNGWRWRIFQRDNNGMETTSNMIVSPTIVLNMIIVGSE
jgi:hypothetical protein